jgi:SAM-dependent methyltransferase
VDEKLPRVPAPSPDAAAYAAVSSAYDAVADDYALHLPDTRAEADLDLAMLNDFIASVTAAGNGPVLDAGCGTGRITRYLTDRGCTVEGVDVSPGMVTAARRAHPDLTFAVASITDLPYRAATFTGVLLWYSTIHTPPALLPGVFTEMVRVLRPGGHLLVAFQAGVGTHDLAPTYRRYGHDIHLERHLFDVDKVATQLRAAGLHETGRLVRAPQGTETDPQAMLIARTT